MVTADANFVNMLRYSMLAISLLPEISISRKCRDLVHYWGIQFFLAYRYSSHNWWDCCNAGLQYNGDSVVSTSLRQHSCVLSESWFQFPSTFKCRLYSLRGSLTLPLQLHLRQLLWNFSWYCKWTINRISQEFIVYFVATRTVHVNKSVSGSIFVVVVSKDQQTFVSKELDGS